jgi:hypothetical protein
LFDDHLRPLIIKENNLDVLVNLCTLVQQMSQSGNTNPLSEVLDKISQDAQARVVFRAQNFIHAAIENYKPQPLDFDYPERLSGT